MEMLDGLPYNIVIQKVSFTDALYLIKQGEHDYEEPLSQLIDINFFADKWSKLAKFIIVKDNDNLVALLIFYENAEMEKIYATHFVVSSKYRNQGIGQKVLHCLHMYAKNIGYKFIELEVIKNSSAYKLYNKFGYLVQENRNDKFLMRYIL
jgi:ribosomal protein S18 acetylase RimI-like enzyme